MTTTQNYDLTIPKTVTPPKVWLWHIFTPPVAMVAISIILAMVLRLLAGFDIIINPKLILISIPLVLLAYGIYEQILVKQHWLVPMYFALVIEDEITKVKRVIFDGTSRLALPERPEELQDGSGYNYLDLKRTIAHNHGGKNPGLIFETSKGGSAEVNYLLAINADIDGDDYYTSSENVLRFNAKHPDALIEEIDKKITGWMSTFYSTHQFTEKGKGRGLVYEQWVYDTMFGVLGEYRQKREELEKRHGVKIGISIYSSNPIKEILDARNKVNVAKSVRETMEITAAGLKKQGIAVDRADQLTRLIFGYTTQKDENFNIKITGLEKAQNISIVGIPKAHETSKPTEKKH